jgi:oligoendopeptidase F
MLLSLHGAAQQYNPFDGNEAAFHVKLNRYFKTEDDEKAHRKVVTDSINRFKADTVWTLDNLGAHLDNYGRLLVAIERHIQYFRLRTYINKNDSLARQAAGEVDQAESGLEGITGRMLLQPRFSSITDQQLDQYHLNKYKFLLAKAQEQALHNLPEHDEQLLGKVSDDMIDHLTDRYDNLMNTITGDSVAIKNKNYSPVKIWTGILLNPDSTLRRQVSQAYYKAYSDHAEVIAAALIDITHQKSILAKLRGYKSAADRVYGRRLQLPEESVKKMLNEMTQYAGVLKNYQQVQAYQIKKQTGLATVHSWDTSLPMGFTWQPLPFAKVRALILDALAPLGKEYTQHFAALLDPANGQMDIAGGPNRVSENTSVGFIDVPESLYMRSYNGALSAVSRLIHEGGHAIHEQLMSDNRIIPAYKNGPSILYEAYAMLNELLLLDALEKQEKSDAGKAFYTKQFVDKLSHEIFTSAEEGAFEQGLYDGVAQGSINTREDVDKLYAGIMNKFDSYFPNEPQRKSEWINKRLLFDDPLYNVNYLYAILISCKLYQVQHADPKGFAVKYTALLKNGFDAPADDLLKKFTGFSLDSGSLLKDALGLMRDKTAKLEALYAK